MKLGSLKCIGALAGLALLGACATATPYQAAGDGNRGYASQQIETDRWKVSFSGNSMTDRNTVETYLLYRAAELTDQRDYEWFQIVTRQTDESKRFVSTGPDPYFGPYHFNYYAVTRSGRLVYFPTHYGWRGGFHDPFYSGRIDYREIVRYEADAEIVMGKGETPDGAEYFTADDVLANLAMQIQRPEPIT
ncbi:MAG: hypothetical protein AAGJ84_02390 [Pseudomonadota bacterium]